MSQPQEVASPVIESHTSPDPVPELEKQEKQETHDTEEKHDAPVMEEKKDIPEIPDKQDITLDMEDKPGDEEINEKTDERIEKPETKIEEKLEDKFEDSSEDDSDDDIGKNQEQKVDEKPEEKPEEKPSQNDVNIKRLSSGMESDDSVSVGLLHIPLSNTAVPVTTDCIPSLVKILTGYTRHPTQMTSLKML